MTTAPPIPCLEQQSSDPLLARVELSLCQTFYPLGFRVDLETNHDEVLLAAAESWGEHAALPYPGTPTMRIRLGVTPASSTACPPTPSLRANDHLLSIIADPENFAVCDLNQAHAFGWISTATLHHRSYLRYHFLEAIALCLLSGSCITPIHGACIGLHGRGLLLCGESGAGKSTLAYACARSGWSFTSDDASYVLWNRPSPTLRGNAHQIRFRPSARDLFPEIGPRALTSRTQGKPSIEVPTRDLPIPAVAPETAVHAIVILHRHPHSTVEINRLTRDHIAPYLEASLFPLRGIRHLQAAALEPILHLPVYEIRYRDLPPAIAALEQLILTQLS